MLSFSFLILAMARSFLGLGVLRFLTVHSLGVSALCVVICGNAALAQSKESSPAGPDKAKASYQQLCQRCHAADGKGDRDTPSVPDFTRRAWQAEKSNAQLIVSILDGRGSSMPAFRGRLDQAEAKDLVAHVRAFANGATKRSSSPKNSKDFETQMQKLQIEYEGLKKQLEELKPEMPPEKRSQKSTEKEESQNKKKEAFGEASVLFRRHCQRCHGTDGKGIAGKLDSPEPPDFTRRTWQEERSNARMLKSILDGRKKGMPAFHDDLTEDQARDLVDYVRAFLPPRSANSTKPRPGAQ